MKTVHFRTIVLGLTALFLSSCGEFGYYFQAVKGEVSLLAKRKPISQLINAPDTPLKVKTRLELVERIRNFAIETLLLPKNGSYTSLVKVKTKHVVWNVYVAPEFSVTPEKWCFPVAGCVNYRGYFSRSGAEKYRRKYDEKGFDTYIGSSVAFSTLGWFDDPVYSTFLHWPVANLAGLIFHELAHAKVYVKDDSFFNESFAMAVEIEGVRRWLQSEGSPGDFDFFLKRRKHNEEFTNLMLKVRKNLEEMYQSTVSETEKRVRKKEIIEEGRREYERLKKGWEADNRWDGWVSTGLNNAKLASIATYNKYVPVFTSLIREKKNDMGEFYEAVSKLAALEKGRREEELKRRQKESL